jgi:hypothetical protein
VKTRETKRREEKTGEEEDFTPTKAGRKEERKSFPTRRVRCGSFL